MSFAIRKTYGPRNLTTSEQPVFSQTERCETERIMETMKQFGKRSSHHSLLSSSDLQNLIRNSSVNPDINRSATKGINTLMENKIQSQANPFGNQQQSASAVGFSTNTVNQHNRDQYNSQLDQELNREIENIRERAQLNRSDEIPDDQISLSSSSSSSSSSEKINNDKDAKSRYAMSIGYPKTASMVRGFSRQGSQSGQSIKKVAMGMADGF